RVDRGEAITRTLQSPDGREITTVGAIRVNCSADTFLARIRDIERFKASEYLLQMGRFGAQPSPDDVASLVVDDDRAGLRTCRPGSCSWRLPARAMQHLRATIPWGAKNEAEVATAEIRTFLVAEAAAYVAGGTPALAEYADDDGDLSRAAAFKGLVRPSPFGSEYQAEVFDFLERYPAAPRPEIESILYWSRERFGLKPMLGITHTAILRRGDLVMFASKQVFTNHYFDGSLGMAVYVAEPGTQYGYVTYMNRTRVEGLHGPMAGLMRAVAARRGRDGLEKTLLEVRKKLEVSDSRVSPQKE
ncbi:MAG TPA: hypothetical protein VF147_15360, partial [Vicinamibacterales bacterium]